MYMCVYILYIYKTLKTTSKTNKFGKVAGYNINTQELAYLNKLIMKY